MLSAPRDLLDRWLSERLTAPARTWLHQHLDESRAGASATYFVAFGQVGRRVGRTPLGLDSTELDAALAARSGWQPAAWTLDQAARTRLLLALPTEPEHGYLRTLDTLFTDASLAEAVALYQALPLLPHPHALRARAAEGVRSNMRAVFEAVALANPYPAEALEEGAWNQLVLKCLFLGAPLWRVVGVDERVNASLADMLVDYARERWAAARPVSPELWRCVAPLAAEPGAPPARLAALARALADGGDLERLGAALACAQTPETRSLLDSHPELRARVDGGALEWKRLG